MNSVTPYFRAKRGFSLLELLVTIAILGLLANLAVFALGVARRGAEEQRDKRNAQEIASVAAVASAAGAQFAVAGNEEATLANLAAGVRPNDGPFRNREFRIPPMSPRELDGAGRYLTMVNTDLVYDQEQR